MPVPSFGGLPPYPTFEDVTNKVNRLVNELRNLLLNLDSLNVVSLTADHIDAGTLDAGVVTVRVDYNSGSYIRIDKNGMVINDGTKDVFSVDTNGNVIMTGATVQSDSSYPRVEIDPNGNIIRVSYDADTYIVFQPDYLTGFPVIGFHDGIQEFWVGYFPNLGKFSIADTGASTIELSTFGDIRLYANGTLYVPDWAYVENYVKERTLQQELDDIWDAIEDLQDRVDALENP